MQLLSDHRWDLLSRLGETNELCNVELLGSDVVRSSRSYILFLCKTKICKPDVEVLLVKLNFAHCLIVSRVGLSGGSCRGLGRKI